MPVTPIPISVSEETTEDSDTLEDVEENDTNSEEYYDYILRLNPSRIIFNPGTENSDLESIASKNRIEVVENCTLVMLDYGLF